MRSGKPAGSAGSERAYPDSQITQSHDREIKMNVGQGGTNNAMTDFNFFLPMVPPTVTDQQHRIRSAGKGKRAIVYDSPELAAAKDMLKAHLAKALQQLKRDDGFKTIVGQPVCLHVFWCFPTNSKHIHGELKTTKPDTDNLQKALKDCMTKVGFWKDDALVAREEVIKLYADIPGIWVRGNTMNKLPMASMMFGVECEDDAESERIHKSSEFAGGGA